MATVNLLFLAPHWRATLVRAFRESWRGLPGRLVGADSDPLAAALQGMENAHVIPRFNQPQCLETLTGLCGRESAQAIVPLSNRAIEFLDQNRAAFPGIELFLPAPETVAICHDKWRLAEYLNGLRLATPPSWLVSGLPSAPPFPLIAKPRRGEGGRSVVLIETPEELGFYVPRLKDHLLQPWLDGVEYSIDWYSDREGNPRVVVPRRRLSVRAGEVMQSRIDLDPAIIDAAQVLGGYLGLRGPATLQGIRTADGSFYFTDINLRFGSGYVHTLAAGADVPAMIYRDLAGEAPDREPPPIQNGSIMTRYLDGFFS